MLDILPTGTSSCVFMVSAVKYSRLREWWHRFRYTAVLSQFFGQSPMECSSTYVSEIDVFITIGFRPGFAPRALNWEKP